MYNMYYPYNQAYYQQQPYNQPQYPQQGDYPEAPRSPQSYTPQEPQKIPNEYHKYAQLKRPTLEIVKPWVRYGLQEAKFTSVEHAMTEVAAIAYLIGRGYDPKSAHYIVESWEKNEHF